VIPAEIVAGTVAVRADAGAQPLYLGDQRNAVQCFEIFVHAPHSFAKPYSRSTLAIRTR